MMRTFHGSEVSVPQTVHGQEGYARPQSSESRPSRAAAVRSPTTLVERVRTFVDRTLDAAFGRFDH